MHNFCECRNNCTLYALIVSIIIGFVTALLTITGIITVGTAFLWVALGIAVVYLALLLLKADDLNNTTTSCNICSILTYIFAGILGTIVVALVLLAVTFAATSIIGAVITGALLFFLSLLITATVCLIKCIAKCNN